MCFTLKHSIEAEEHHLALLELGELILNPKFRVPGRKYHRLNKRKHAKIVAEINATKLKIKELKGGENEKKEMVKY